MLNGLPADTGNVVIAPGTSPAAGMVMNADGTIATATTTLPGTYTFPYTICSVFDPTICATAQASLTVDSVVVATDDGYGTVQPGAVTVSVLVNDTLNGHPATLTNVTLTPGMPSDTGLTMDDNGVITVAATTPPGTYAYSYTICSIIDPGVCDTAEATMGSLR